MRGGTGGGTGRAVTVVAIGLLGLGLLAGCSGRGGGGDSSASGKPTVVAAFYPLAYAARQVAGDTVDVIDLTPPGAEPHDLELSPQQVAEIAQADLVVYIPGFQPAVDDAIAQEAADRALDATSGIDVIPGDPHVWLNPLNEAIIGTDIADRLAQIDPSLAKTVATGSSQLTDAMAAMNDQWTAATATCANRDLVVSHAAFAYLARQYDFQQEAIAGLSPDAEPSPARLSEIAGFVRDNGVTTIYYETLVDPKVAQTIASETGATTAVLDPIEGLPDGSADDYTSIMGKNLQTLVDGQGCRS